MKLIVIDFETTGLDERSCGITEIVGIEYTRNMNYVRPVINSLFHPVSKIPKVVEDLTGITNEMVKYMVSYVEGINQLAEIAKKEEIILIAHNAEFEKKFLVYNHNIFKDVKFICTRGLYLAYKDGNNWENKFKRNYSKLKQVCENFNITYDETKAHRAEYDVLKTSEVAKKLIDYFGIEKALEISKATIENKGWGKRRQISYDEIIY